MELEKKRQEEESKQMVNAFGKPIGGSDDAPKKHLGTFGGKEGLTQGKKKEPNTAEGKTEGAEPKGEKMCEEGARVLLEDGLEKELRKFKPNN